MIHSHQEREAAKKIFKGKKGKEFMKDIGKKTKTFVAGQPIGDATASLAKEMTKAQIQEIADIKVFIFVFSSCFHNITWQHFPTASNYNTSRE